ncbi:flagellar filament capping protein FliD [Sphingomonas sp.]|uniref:flagellar filament capping protein FliD n=1 Tax=Sphingomonas sp. TaxID=28214 RepID=UPI002B7DA8C6|nr:flagellar filament capping protein FliD [Sphingomonas sp.]HTG37575.1 flagellar filament capping protein FliD [Sphingomonas sp.]
MALAPIASTLGVGSGIDISALVEGLVDAQFSTRNAVLDQREETLTAQISAASELKSAISGFSSALAALARGGSLSTQPTSGDTSVVRTSLLTGGNAANVSATVEVQQIAQAQASHSGLIDGSDSVFETGTLTLTFGSATVDGNGAMTGFTAGGGAAVDIVIDESNSTLSGIANAINAKQAGVTASIVSDVNGERLVLKGATGDSQAFTLSATASGTAPPNPDGSAPAALSDLAVGVGGASTIGTAARDAIVEIDGVAVRRASNSINNLIPGVRLELVSAKPGTLVQIGASAPTEGLSQAVQDFVSTYNELQSMIGAATNPLGGSLRADTAARNLKTQLSRLVATPLLDDASGPRTLAEIGVATNRDGTLRVDTARLVSILSSDPQAVEAMFASGAGLPAAMSAIATAATDTRMGLGASETRYTDQVEDVADAREAALTAAETLRTRMTQQFASMDARVASYRSTQSFLEQQVAAWNAQND